MLFDNLKISRKLTLGFAAVTLTMAGMGGAMLVNLRALDEARVEIKESRETLVTLNEAKFYLTRQENSYRGYLLSKNDYYLERVDKHRANFKTRLDAARPADRLPGARRQDRHRRPGGRHLVRRRGEGRRPAQRRSGHPAPGP